MYGGHIWIYLVAFLSLMFLFFYFNFETILLSKLNIKNVIAIDATAWGVIGGLLQGLWWLWINIDKMAFRKVWIIRFISTPFIGGLMGALAYFLIFGGLLVISQDKEPNPRTEAVIVAAILAGFNWDWTLDRLKEFGSKLSGKESKDNGS